MGLGLSIVGGSDTLLGAIFIHEVYEKGAAHKDGRLRPGDQVRGETNIVRYWGRFLYDVRYGRGRGYTGKADMSISTKCGKGR